MDQSHEFQQEVKKVQDKDFTHNWVSSSSFLFYLQAACMVAFIFGGCFMLSKSKYQGKPSVIVPESSLYTPIYK